VVALLRLDVTPAVAGPGEPVVPLGWVSRPVPASSDSEWTCANWSPDEWSVSTASGRLEISRADSAQRAVSLPFEPLLAPDEDEKYLTRPSVVHAVPGGYLVGYDRGEFGGGLYWFSANGRRHTRLAPAARAHSDWFPENVRAISEYNGTLFVFQGVSHLTLRMGRVLKVRPSDKGWLVAVLVVLEATPEVVFEERPGKWLMASTNGVSRVNASGTVTRLWGSADVLVYVYPSSIARTADGNVYVGMRAWVLRLLMSHAARRWRADVLAPSSCARFVRKTDERCSCISAGTGE